jgi:hypothetical protein
MNEPTTEVRHQYLGAIRRWCAQPLSNPQYAELNSVLDWYEESAGERDELQDELATLKAQRDALLALLIDAKEALLNDEPDNLRGILAGDICTDAIAQAKGTAE